MIGMNKYTKKDMCPEKPVKEGIFPNALVLPAGKYCLNVQ
jgi:hypothetical protein